MRGLIDEELDALKDIIVQFWDGEYFIKVTGGAMPKWYVPQKDPMTGIVLNPLADILTGDYNIKSDITTALRPNKERQKEDMVRYMMMMADPDMIATLNLLQIPLTVVKDAIKKVSKEFGVNPELFEQQEGAPQMPEEQPEPIEVGETITKQTTEKADELGNKQKMEQTQKEKIFQ